MSAIKQQARAEWLARRRNGICGSDVAPILGLSPWKTALDVWAEKRGLVEPLENESMTWGRRLEAVVADAFTEETGIKLVAIPDELLPRCHPQRPWQLASPDRATVDGSAVVEIKTASARAAEEWGLSGTDQIPDAYLLQTLWYLNTLDAQRGYVAVLIGGQEFRVFIVERNPRLESMMVGRAEEFWRNNVLGGIEPKPTPRDGETLARIHKRESTAMLVTSALDTEAERLAEIRSEISRLDAEREKIETEIKAVIGSSGGIEGSNWRATWVPCKGRFSAEAALKAGAITRETIEKFRGESSRKLNFKFKGQGDDE